MYRDKFIIRILKYTSLVWDNLVRFASFHVFNISNKFTNMRAIDVYDQIKWTQPTCKSTIRSIFLRYVFTITFMCVNLRYHHCTWIMSMYECGHKVITNHCWSSTYVVTSYILIHSNTLPFLYKSQSLLNYTYQ